MNFFRFKSIRTRLAFWLFFVGLVPVSVLLYLFYEHRVTTLKNDSFQRLVAIRDLKVRQLNAWLDERSGDVLVLSESIAHSFYLPIHLHKDEDVKDLFKNFLTRYDAYSDVFLVDSETGDIIFSLGENKMSGNRGHKKYISEPIRTRSTFIQDIHFSDNLKIPTMTFSAPVMDKDIEGKVLAVVVMRIDLDESLYRIFNERTALGETGEVLIVNSDVVSLSQVKYSKIPPIELQITAKPAFQAANGKTGIIESLDYRGEPVLAAYTYLPITRWGFVAKQDLSEIYAPVYDLVTSLISLMLGLVTVVIIVSYFISNRLALPIFGMIKVAKLIEGGEGTARNQINSDDEIGYLAKSFNEMAATLEVEKQALKDYLYSIIGSMPSILIGVNENFEVELWNTQAEKLTGVNAKQVIGVSVFHAMPLMEKYTNLIQNVIKGKHSEVIRNIEFTKDGKSYYFDITIYPIVGFEKQGVVIMLDDVTESLEKDEMIRRSQKMDALGKLTGGVAHDFNNMLGVILGYAELVMRKKGKDSDVYSYISEIKMAGERAKTLTAKLLSFSRKEAGLEQIVVDLNELVKNEKEIISKTLTASVELKLELAKDLWPVKLDQNRFEDALLNLCINSKHAMPNGGELTLSTRNLTLSHKETHQQKLVPGDYVLVSVTDNGCGMTNEVVDKIFDPFFTTKGYDGTGLGLSQVYGFAQQSNGVIDVYSEPGQGTRMVFYFPRYHDVEQGDVANAQSSEADTVLFGGNETILVVDDEAALIALAKEILTSSGYKVFTATNADEALTILDTTDDINLMLSDVIMPGLNGYELAAAVHEKYPRLKIQMVSGYTDTRTENNDYLQQLHEQRLLKPYNTEDLLRKIREILD